MLKNNHNFVIRFWQIKKSCSGFPGSNPGSRPTLCFPLIKLFCSHTRYKLLVWKTTGVETAMMGGGVPQNETTRVAYPTDVRETVSWKIRGFMRKFGTHVSDRARCRDVDVFRELHPPPPQNDGHRGRGHRAGEEECWCSGCERTASHVCVLDLFFFLSRGADPAV